MFGAIHLIRDIFQVLFFIPLKMSRIIWMAQFGMPFIVQIVLWWIHHHSQYDHPSETLTLLFSDITPILWYSSCNLQELDP